MVRIKAEWRLHRTNNESHLTSKGGKYYCGAPIHDMGEITDKQALSLPLCTDCFPKGIQGYGKDTSAGGEEAVKQSAKRSVSHSRKGVWL